MSDNVRKCPIWPRPGLADFVAICVHLRFKRSVVPASLQSRNPTPVQLPIPVSGILPIDRPRVLSDITGGPKNGYREDESHTLDAGGAVRRLSGDRFGAA